MELFKDKSGLKVISVGFLLGMVSYLHGMPASSLSLSFHGDKVVLVYSGDIEQLDASAIDFLSAASFIDHHVFVIDAERHLVAIDQKSQAFGSLLSNGPLSYSGLGVDFKTNAPKAGQSVDWTCEKSATYNSFHITEWDNLVHPAVTVAFRPSAFLSSANAVRAGPLA